MIRPWPSDPRYHVSDTGIVYGRQDDLPMGGELDHNGYRVVHVRAAAGERKRKVHQMVLETFVGPAPQGAQVRHLNGDKTDNRLENLTYGNASENALDQIAHGTHFNSGKTHCPSGHEYAPDNTSWIRTTPGRRAYRRCRRCNRERVAAWKARRRASSIGEAGSTQPSGRFA